MKKILNNPADYVDEMLEGLTAAHPEFYRLVGETKRAVARATPGKAGKVGIVSGGGSGHLPVFTGYVGPGLLDACAIGDVFASPSAEQMADAIRAADQGAGVLRLYGNYGGDVLNFQLAEELLDGEIPVRSYVVHDDVASSSRRESRRGIAGMCLLFKVAGASAARGDSLDGLHVLFIGNSYTARNDLPGLVTMLAESAGAKLNHQLISAGGVPWRWVDAISPAALPSAAYA